MVKVTMVYKGDLLLHTQVFELVVHILDFGLEIFSILAVTYRGYADLDIGRLAPCFRNDLLHLFLRLHVVVEVVGSSVDNQHVWFSAESDLCHLDSDLGCCAAESIYFHCVLWLVPVSDSPQHTVPNYFDAFLFPRWS